jgi:protein-tyrosine phosphatase
MPNDNTAVPSILFVCTKNRCRSVAAAALLAQRLPQLAADWAAWQISSAGTWATEGEPPLAGMCRLLRSRGIEVGDVKSRRVTGELLSAHRLTLVMEPGHKEALQVEFPGTRERIFMLSEMAGHQAPVPDPETDLAESYAACLQEIDAWLKLGEPRIVSLARMKTE